MLSWHGRGVQKQHQSAADHPEEAELGVLVSWRARSEPISWGAGSLKSYGLGGYLEGGGAAVGKATG